MDFGLPPIAGGDPAVGRSAGSGRASRPGGPEPGDFRVALSRAALPDGGPPPELRAELRAAARRADELRALGRELHFERDEQGGRIRIEVRDLDGNLIETLQPSHALAVAAGAPVG